MGRFSSIVYCIGLILVLQSCSGLQGEEGIAGAPGFFEINSFLPGNITPIQTDVRYFSSDNFVGSPIDGYHADRIFVTTETALALAAVQIDLAQRELGLKVFDGYRPQRAVDHFLRWAADIDDTSMKQQYYPDVAKEILISDGYISTRSGHSRGSTVDLTLIDIESGEELDMGTSWDFFDPKSWPTSLDVSLPQKTNREILREIMLRHGFNPLREEWWHFTLDNEPFPNSYFDYPID